MSRRRRGDLTAPNVARAAPSSSPTSGRLDREDAVDHPQVVGAGPLGHRDRRAGQVPAHVGERPRVARFCAATGTASARRTTG